MPKGPVAFFFSKRDREDGESVCVFLPLSRFLQPGLAYLLIRLFLICDRLHYPPFDLQKLQSVFSTETVRIMQSKNSPRIHKDQRGQSSLAFLVFFHHFPLKFVTFDMPRVSICDFFFFFSFQSMCGNSGVCIPKADETPQKSPHN